MKTIEKGFFIFGADEESSSKQIQQFHDSEQWNITREAHLVHEFHDASDLIILCDFPNRRWGQVDSKTSKLLVNLDPIRSGSEASCLLW